MGIPTFDYLAGTPWIITPAIEEAIETAVAADESVTDAIRRATTDEFRTNPDFKQEYCDRFANAGVDVASVTVDGSPSRDGLLEWQARFDASDRLRKITSPAEARTIAGTDAVGILLNTQNLGADIDGDVRGVDPLYDAGLRVFQLTYNTHNLVGAGCYDRSAAGLSTHGEAVVRRLNRHGAVIDLSHCGTETTMAAIEESDAPVAVTHSSCGAVADHPRAKSERELEALAAADGYFGVVGVPWFLAPETDNPSLQTWFDHLEHAVSVMGIERVGIGTDFGNVDAGAPGPYVSEARERAVAAGFPEGYGEEYGTGYDTMQRYTDWPLLREGLENRFTDEEVAGICGGNFFGFWDRVEEAA